MRTIMLRAISAIILTTATIAPTQFANAQQAPLPLDSIKTPQQLEATVIALDKQLFDAYNTCDLASFSSLVDDNVEFYHDQGGVTLGNKDLTASIKKNICGTTTREIVPATLKIYPMKGYGAVEIGDHLFLHPWKQDHGVVGRGRFIMLWQYKNGAWKLTRVISYDHALAK
jgi:hypothetical protein